MSKYLTVVFEYDEGAALPKQLTKAFAENLAFEGVNIVAISLEDEISRVEQLEDHLLQQ